MKKSAITSFAFNRDTIKDAKRFVRKKLDELFQEPNSHTLTIYIDPQNENIKWSVQEGPTILR